MGIPDDGNGFDLSHVCFAGRRPPPPAELPGHRSQKHWPCVHAAVARRTRPRFCRLGHQPGRTGCEPLPASASPAAAPACLRTLKVRSTEEARELLENRPDLLPAAVGSLLIGVTEFFRDPRFSRACGRRFCRLAAGRGPLRVWSAGCSTGEELYSLAILLAEAGLLAGSFLLGTDCRTEAIRAGPLRRSMTPRRARPAIREQVLRAGGQSWRVIEPLRRQVRWEVADLAEKMARRSLGHHSLAKPGDLPESRPRGNALEPADRGLGARGLPDRGQGRAPAVGLGPGAGVPVRLSKSSGPLAQTTVSEEEYAMSVGTKIGVGFALGLVMLAAVGGSAYVSTQRLLEANRRVVHTHEVQEKLDDVLSAHLDAETGQRGFIITGEERTWSLTTRASAGSSKTSTRWPASPATTRAQQESLQQLRKLSDAKLAELRETIRLRKESGLAGRLPVILTDRGKKIMDDLRGVVAEMEAREQTLLEERTAAAEASASRTIWTIAVWMPLALVVLAVAAVVLMRTVRFGGPAAAARHGRQGMGRHCHPVRLGGDDRGRGRGVALAVGGVLRPAAPVYHFLSGGAVGGEHRRRRAGNRGHRALGVGGRLLVHSAVWSFSIDAPNDVLALGIFTGANLFLCVLAERLRRARWAEAVSVAQQERAEELARQNEELARQSEELSQQAEELRSNPRNCRDRTRNSRRSPRRSRP